MDADRTRSAPDSVADLPGDTTPAIVSISDIHGYLNDARSALRAVGESSVFDPVVTTEADGLLHWAGNDYVLVVNGDAIDRGPDSAGVVRLIDRLASEAPPGRIRYHLGNHEMAALFPSVLDWSHWYCGQLDSERRLEFYERVREGLLTAAFDGYEYRYSHAGQPSAFDVSAANDQLREEDSVLLVSEGNNVDPFDHVHFAW
ncbi:metallophosphoesterase [Halobaculum marinum]|uniref:Metallophosphoesterase n=1 Tax=Halobaculum marinum TaxID=3031996 RepID=A0ABD5WU20_9EURY|nr:metallophosphoesterase [Halobaculum sp. DT55]